MIRQNFTIRQPYWKVYVYYNVTLEDAEEIVDKLVDLKLPKSYITGAYTTLESNKVNQGITQSNISLRESVIIFTKTTNASQFVNSFVHEIGHLATHIAIAYNIDLKGEDVQYIAGDIAQEMFKQCHTLMCDCCRKE